MFDFQIYPAIDLKDGNCVRLVHGKKIMSLSMNMILLNK